MSKMFRGCFDWIHLIFASNVGLIKGLYECNILPDQTTDYRVSKTLMSLLFSDPIDFILAGNEYLYKSLLDFEFLPIPISDKGVNCP